MIIDKVYAASPRSEKLWIQRTCLLNLHAIAPLIRRPIKFPKPIIMTQNDISFGEYLAYRIKSGRNVEGTMRTVNVMRLERKNNMNFRFLITCRMSFLVFIGSALPFGWTVVS
jgi:hypothetical protein